MKTEKKSMRFAFLIFFFLYVAESVAKAQIDPSSAMLLNANHNDTRESGFETGRYTVKPKGSERKGRGHLDTRANSASGSTVVTTTTTTTSVTPVATPAPAQAAPVSTATPSPTTAPTPAPAPTATPAASTSASEPSPSANPSPNFSERGDDFTRPQAPAAPRANGLPSRLLEISFAPGYLYNDSKSTFAPRNYSVNAPTAAIDATIWLKPSFGVRTSFTSTINANVSDSLNNTANATVSEQWFTAGVRSRSYFGDSARAPSLTFGLDYREYEFRVPSDTLLRDKLATSGLVLTLEAEMPFGRYGAYQIGVEFGPALSHRETSNSYNFSSGASPKTTAVGAFIGARYRFDLSNEMFWKLSWQVEKNQFEGSTPNNDPVSGQPQTNVSVTNSFSLFQLGYRWGN